MPGAKRGGGERWGGRGGGEGGAERSRGSAAPADARRQPACTSPTMLRTRSTAWPPLLRSATNPSKPNQPPKKKPQKGVFVSCHHGLSAATCHSFPNRAGLEQRATCREKGGQGDRP